MLSSIGSWMQNAAQQWLVLKIGHSAGLLGLDGFLQGVPIVFLTLFGGVLADRIDRRRILLISQVIQMASALALAGLIISDTVKVEHILALSFISGCAQAFGGPAYQALIPSIVGKEHLPNAIAMNSIQFNLARIIGPVLAGLTLQYGDGEWCFLINGLSFIAPIISLLIVTPNFTPSRATVSIMESMKQGFSFILDRQGMLPLIGLAFTMTLLGLPIIQFLPVFTKQVYAGGPETFTLLLSVSGVGSVVGALIVAGRTKKTGKGRLALILLAVLGSLIALFGWTRWLPLSFAAIFFVGAALMGAFQMIASLVQEISTDEMRGRVMSIYNVAFRGGMPIGSAVTGQMMDMFPSAIVLTVEGLLLIVLTGYFAVRHRKITKM